MNMGILSEILAAMSVLLAFRYFMVLNDLSHQESRLADVLGAVTSPVIAPFRPFLPDTEAYDYANLMALICIVAGYVYTANATLSTFFPAFAYSMVKFSLIALLIATIVSSIIDWFFESHLDSELYRMTAAISSPITNRMAKRLPSLDDIDYTPALLMIACVILINICSAGMIYLGVA